MNFRQEQEKTYENCIFIKKETMDHVVSFYDRKNVDRNHLDRVEMYAKRLLGDNTEYGISDTFAKMLENKAFKDIVTELVEYGIGRYLAEYRERYQNTNLVLYKNIHMKMRAGCSIGSIMKFR